MEQEENYEFDKEGNLTITIVQTEQEVRFTNEMGLPTGDLIGMQEQTIIQKIPKDKIELITENLYKQRNMLKDEIGKTEMQLQQLNNVETDLIPEDVLKKINKGLEKPQIKKAFADLNNYISAASKKKGLQLQKVRIEKALENVDKQLAGIQGTQDVS